MLSNLETVCAAKCLIAIIYVHFTREKKFAERHTNQSERDRGENKINDAKKRWEENTSILINIAGIYLFMLTSYRPINFIWRALGRVWRLYFLVNIAVRAISMLNFICSDKKFKMEVKWIFCYALSHSCPPGKTNDCCICAMNIFRAPFFQHR